jgi:serine/threonine protein kinase
MHLDSVDSTFENEKYVIQFLRQVRHRNMVQLLSSFSIELPKLGSVKYLLSPLADGSLQELLDRDARDSKDVIRLLNTDENVFSELFGLASALENLHMYVNIADGTRLKGNHFDLAPRNILIYQGKLVLADFGLSRLRNETSNSYTPFKGGVDHYLTPECIDEDFAPLNKYGSKSHIWSFGGILAVRKFEQTRKLVREGTTYRFHDNGKEHPNLKQAMKDIAGVSSIEMTALDISSWILVVEPAQRPTAEMVSTELYVLAQVSRYHRIDDLFCNLSSKVAAIQLKIEEERFTIWCGCASLAKHYDTRVTMRRDKSDQISWLVYSKEKYQVVADLLKEVQKEIEFLLTVIEVDSPVAPIFAHLRDLNDTLWCTVPLQDRKEMFRLFENGVERIYTLEHGGDIDLQQITSKNMPSWEKRAILIAMLKFRNNNPAAE